MENKIVCALPEIIDLQRLAEQDATYATKLDANLMPRLKEVCVSVDDAAIVNLHFFKDLQGLNTIEGKISCNVALTCERCGKPFDLTLEAPFSVTCDLEKAKQLKIDDKLDFVELEEDGKFNLYAFIEDCLLLEIPTIPRHDEDNCEIKGSKWIYKEEAEDDETNPFAMLKDLKGKLSKE